MRELLLDTCTFIWLASDPEKLSAGAAGALEDPALARRMSMGSVLEIALKYRTGKLPLPQAPRYWVEEQARLQNIAILPLEREAIYRSGELPRVHADPFDRLIAADALIRGMPVVSPDAPFATYGCDVVW